MSFLVIEVVLTRGLITPGELPALLARVEERISQAGGKEGVVLSGRLPIWVYSSLVHFFHPRPWVATYDPRLGAVVVQSHVADLAVGDVVPIIGQEDSVVLEF